MRFQLGENKVEVLASPSTDSPQDETSCSKHG